MSFKPNDSQKAVIEREDNICVIAGAGSGKTGTLIESIVSRLEASRKFSDQLSITDILALTFTEKAAAELRERLLKSFKKRHKISSGEEESNFWRRESSRLDRADIGTIHAYALKLVRENSLLLGISSSVEVENNDWAFQDDLNNIMIDWLDSGNQDFLSLREVFSRSQLTEFLSFCARRLSAWGMANFSLSPCEAEETNLQQLIENFRENVQNAANFIDAGGIKSEAKYFSRVSSAVAALKAAVDLKSVDADNVSSAFSYWGQLVQSSGDWHTVEGRKIKKSLAESFDRLWQKHAYDLSLPLKEKALRLTEQLVSLISERKKRRGVLDFDDILIYARRLLAKRPDIRRREIKRRRLIMIDEFQDTNRLQANILAYLLLDEDDTTVYEEDYDLWSSFDWKAAKARLHVFGDLKQSIYRFRGAEIKVMDDFKIKLEQGAGSVLPLNTNYRTQKKLIDFFNDFFPCYLEHLYSSHDNQASARPSFYDAMPLTLLKSSTEPQGVALKAQTQAQLTVAYLKDLFAGKLGVKIDSEDGILRTPRPGDVAILFRRFKYANLFTEAIAAQGWKYQVSSNGNPSAYSEVRGVLCAFRYLNGFDVESSLVGALRSPLGPVSDSGLTELVYAGEEKSKIADYFTMPPRPWPDSLNKNDRKILDEIRNLFHNLKLLIGRVKSVEILERIIDKRGLLSLAMLNDDGPQRMRALQSFLALSRGLSKKRDSNPLSDAEELTELWRQWQGEAQENLDDDAIKILTVHSAKGLEFPVVLIAEADRVVRMQNSSPVLSDDGRLSLSFKLDGLNVKPPDYDLIVAENEVLAEQEERRLFYVAATRARDHLVLIGWPKTKSGSSSRRSWLDAVNDFSEDKQMCAWLEYDTESFKAPITPLEPSITETDPVTAPPLNMLKPVCLKSDNMAVTSLCNFLSTPEEFYRERYLGWERDFQWKKDGPLNFFPKAKKEKSLKREETLNAAQAGTLFHASLEHYEHSSSEFIELLKSQALRLNLKPEEKELAYLADKLSSFCKHPLGQAWQKSISQYREMPFWLRLPVDAYDAEITLTGVIDLFYISPNGQGQIIDYKLAKMASGRELKAYEYQLQIYAQALRSAGFKAPIRAALYFAEEGNGQAHEISCDNDFLEPLRAQLNKYWPFLLQMRSNSVDIGGGNEINGSKIF